MAIRLCLYWLATEADLSGRCTLRGLALEEEPLSIALDVVYALILDDSPPPRHEARERLDEALARPLDPEEALEYDRERWGLSREAIAEAERKDAMFAEITYEEPER